MANEIADTVDLVGSVRSGLREELLGHRRTLYLLIVAVAVAPPLLGVVDADVVDDGCRLKDELCWLVDILQAAYGGCKVVDLQEMVDASCIAFVVFYGKLDEPCHC